MKIGVCIVTCGDRPDCLKECVKTVQYNYPLHEMVIVNNGPLLNEKIKGVSCVILSGNGGNSPHGQNVGLHYLARQGCEMILKSDDDLIYEVGYLRKLQEVMVREGKEVTAVGGVCWSKNYCDIVKYHKELNSWKTLSGSFIKMDQLGLYRVRNSPRLWTMEHLHGAFLYRVKDALELEKKTILIRGGAFGEYFSKIACREETEFTLLMKRILGKELLYNTSAICFHQYAPGGTRDIYTNELCLEDDKKMREVCRKLGVIPKLKPVWIKPYEN